MPYATSTDLLTAFGGHELAQVSTPKRFTVVGDERLELAIAGAGGFPSGEVDEEELLACLAAINAALGIADSIVDSYIAVRYTIPLATVPISLKKRTLDLARFELHDKRATEEVRKRRDDAIKWLEMLAAGKAKIGDSAIDSGAGSTAGISIVESAGQTFSTKSDNTALAGYGI